MSTELIVLIASLIFQAGGFYIYVRMSLNALDRKVDSNYVSLDEKGRDLKTSFKQDLAGMGEKISRIGALSARRYHNVSVAIMLSTPPEHEKEVALLMKEEN